MARTPERAVQLIEAVWKPAVARGREEVADMQAVADAEGAGITIEPWDYRYYAEKVREGLRPRRARSSPTCSSRSSARACSGWPASCSASHFEPVAAGGVPVFHPDVRVWEVRRGDGRPSGLWYFDPFARPGKRSGAWMSGYRPQEPSTAAPRRSSPTTATSSRRPPAIRCTISWDDALTLFHEFGHALHGLSSQVGYPSLSGTNVLRDYVEFPSQILEHWLATPEILERFAIHVETGEPIPRELVAKIERAASFNQGFATVEFLASSLVDMKLHLAEPPADIAAFERDTLADLGMPKEVAAMRHRLPHFLHLFSGDAYSAAYYSYLWADVLTADAWEAFGEGGGPWDTEAAGRLVRHVFSAGNTVDAAEAYRAFRGRDPDPQALMRSAAFCRAARPELPPTGRRRDPLPGRPPLAEKPPSLPRRDRRYPRAHAPRRDHAPLGWRRRDGHARPPHAAGPLPRRPDHRRDAAGDRRPARRHPLARRRDRLRPPPSRSRHELPGRGPGPAGPPVPTPWRSCPTRSRRRPLPGGAAAGRRVGSAGHWRRWLLTDALPPHRDDRGRETLVPPPVAFMDVAAALGAPRGSLTVELAASAADRAAADAVLDRLFPGRDGPLVILNDNSASGTARAWGGEKLAGLARWLLERLPTARLLVHCGPGDRDQARDVVARAAHPAVAGLHDEADLPIGLSKGLFARADLAVSSDSGPRHIAAAFGVPTVAIVGPIDARLGRSDPDRCVEMRLDLSCSPCGEQRLPARPPRLHEAAHGGAGRPSGPRAARPRQRPPQPRRLRPAPRRCGLGPHPRSPHPVSEKPGSRARDPVSEKPGFGQPHRSPPARAGGTAGRWAFPAHGSPHPVSEKPGSTAQTSVSEKPGSRARIRFRRNRASAGPIEAPRRSRGGGGPLGVPGPRQPASGFGETGLQSPHPVSEKPDSRARIRFRRNRAPEPTSGFGETGLRPAP